MGKQYFGLFDAVVFADGVLYFVLVYTMAGPTPLLALAYAGAQGKTAGSDGRYIKEGHYGHSLELMHPEGAAAADAMSPTHTRVV